MKQLKVPLAFLASAYLALAGGLILTYHRLPERTASHFDAAGHANGWMSRDSQVWAMGGLALGLSALMLGVFYAIRFFPPSVINLPHRDYWLAPGQREETFGFVFRAGVWLAGFEVLFLLGIHLLVIDANSASPARLSPAVWPFGGVFLVAVGAWVFHLIKRFYRLA